MKKRSVSLAVVALIAAVPGALLSGPASATVNDELLIFVDAKAPKAGTSAASGRDGSTKETALSSIKEAEKVAREKSATSVTVTVAPGLYEPFEWNYAPKGGKITIKSETGKVPDEVLAAADARISKDAPPRDSTPPAKKGTPDEPFDIAPDAGSIPPGRAGAPAVTVSESAQIGSSSLADASIAAVYRCNSTQPDYAIKLGAGDTSYELSGAVVELCRNGGLRIYDAAGLFVHNSLFQYIGNRYNTYGSGNGYGGIHMVGAGPWALITDNRFYNHENLPGSGPSEIHGVYAADGTSNFTLEDNNFGAISGDPVRFRNASNNSTIQYNKFWQTGYVAIVSDWRFDADVCSRGNVFSNNVVGYWTYGGQEFNVGQVGLASDPVTVSVRKWGHDAVRQANVGGCVTSSNPVEPIAFGGGNSYTSVRPW
ncbi:right-handed parallel beta-helix repeat-containing protein [Microtetraspora malaysiensis]|uniref:Right-handed parallel beta-helix repeat-containing protein n=1 Tax=Microtetraspora malaysiensis TaxID=161358 RepID=A0ABW6SYL3_9ACTN